MNHTVIHTECHLMSSMHQAKAMLTVETHVLGEGLGQNDVVSLLDEVAHCPGVFVDVAAGKALIGHVEEHQQVPFLNGRREGRG